MKFLVFFILVFILNTAYCQNLIPNYSFEDTLKRTSTLYQPTNWVTATREGWNYFTPYNSPWSPAWSTPQNLIGYQTPRTGIAYIGILIYHLYNSVPNPRREYAHAKLNRTLIQDSTYCFQIHVSMADSSLFSSRNQLGVYFSSNLINYNIFDSLPFIPQIILFPDQFVTEKLSWKEYNFEYLASGGESYLTIGNFNGVGSMDTLYVGGGDSSVIENKSSYYYIDDVWLSHCDSLPDTTIGIFESKKQEFFNVFPNPSSGTVYLDSEEKISKVQLFNLQGKLLANFRSVKQIDLPPQSGLYLIKIYLENGQVYSKKIIRK